MILEIASWNCCSTTIAVNHVNPPFRELQLRLLWLFVWLLLFFGRGVSLCILRCQHRSSLGSFSQPVCQTPASLMAEFPINITFDASHSLENLATGRVSSESSPLKLEHRLGVEACLAALDTSPGRESRSRTATPRRRTSSLCPKFQHPHVTKHSVGGYFSNYRFSVASTGCRVSNLVLAG